MSDALFRETTKRGVDTFFVVVFAIEVLVRMMTFRSVFFLGTEWRWNWFDTVVVLGGVVEVVLERHTDISVVRLLRALRVLRTVKVVRNQPLFFKLRLMLLAMFETVMSLMWTSVLLVGLIALFSVIFVQACAHHMAEGEPSDDTLEVLLTFWHSVPMGILTLYMAITGGVNWWGLEKAFLEVSHVSAAIFVMYQVFMVLALFNIITGVFVNDSIEVAQGDRELRNMALVQRHEEEFKRLRETFMKIDEDGSGAITLDEFVCALHKTDVSMTLESLGVDATNAVRLFETLDVSGDLTLEIDEFVMGCVALTVPAKTVDMELIKGQNRKMLKVLKSLLSSITAKKGMYDFSL